MLLQRMGHHTQIRKKKILRQPTKRLIDEDIAGEVDRLF